MNKIAVNDSLMQDLRIAVKITQTLPIIKDYQKNSLPKIEPLQNYLKLQSEWIEQIQLLMENTKY